MRALCVQDGALVLRQDAPEPEIRAGEALLRPLMAGICNTDLELVRGYYDFEGILGHEFVAEVVGGPPEWVGKRVVGEINVACGDCDFCRAGIPSQCRNRQVLGLKQVGGAFADRFVLPAKNLLPVPETLSHEQAVFTEPLAAACQVLEMGWIKPGARVVVLGAGKLGMLTAQVLRLTGCDLTVVVRHDRQTELLTRWGIASARFSDLEPGQADVVVDCTGAEEGFADALELVRARGTIVLKSTFHGLPRADLSRIAVNELTVIGSRCGPFEAALRLLESGLVDVVPLIERAYTLDEGLAAFEAASRPGALKIVMTFD